MNNNKPIWDGVYQTYREAPKSGEEFSSDVWLSSRVKKINSYSCNSPDCPLPHTVRTVFNDSATILDFGGGIGLTYLQLSLLTNKTIDYHIVDNKKTVKMGQKIFGGFNKRIHFHTNIPNNKIFDIIYMNSSLHYMKDWKLFLQQIYALDHEYLIITEAPIGHVPTFVTVQNLYNSQVPVWFINIEEFVSVIKEIGYTLYHYSHGEGPILMNNFDEKYRIDETSNFIFKK